MKILVATDKPFAAVAVNGIKDVVESAGIELALLEKYGEKSKLLDAVKDVDGLIVRSDIIDAEVLNAAKQLKVVVRAGAGYDNCNSNCQRSLCNEYSRTKFKRSSRISIRDDSHDGPESV